MEQTTLISTPQTLSTQIQTQSQNSIHKNIQILPKELAEKIAAGEVIERPASVIKELVENSIDAGATEITVELEDGGKKKIKITDNGHGINETQILTALERHATSKINKLDDLWNLHTMGFRGEALPSIAAISRFTLNSKTDTGQGRLVYLEGGKILRDETSPVNMISGTQISVEDLFYNVPARLKFQRTKSGESSFVRDMIEHFALTNPTIGFKLFSEERKSLDLKPATGADPQFGRCAEVFDIALDDLEKFESQYENIEVSGYLDRNTRASNSKQVFVAANGRIVKDKLLQQAVITALRPRMMEGEYPRLFMNVRVPMDEIDVNVHPTKSEVRFRKSRDVFQVVHGALSKLATTPSRAFYSVNLSHDTVSKPSTSNTAFHVQENFLDTTGFSYRVKNENLFKAELTEAINHAVQNNIETPKELINAATQATIATRFSSLQYIGQLKNTYLLFQDGEGLVMIDQHAAHERVNYEKIKSEFLKSGLTSQPLLVSITVKCKPEDILVASEHYDSFNKLGFEVEIFGDNCLILRSIPEALDQMKAKELFTSLLNELKEIPASDVLTVDPSRLSPKLERVLSTQACHSSIRAGQPLAPKEATALMNSMETTPSSLNCPHGRPASIRLTYSQIENLFKR